MLEYLIYLMNRSSQFQAQVCYCFVQTCVMANITQTRCRLNVPTYLSPRLSLSQHSHSNLQIDSRFGLGQTSITRWISNVFLVFGENFCKCNLSHLRWEAGNSKFTVRIFSQKPPLSWSYHQNTVLPLLCISNLFNTPHTEHWTGSIYKLAEAFFLSPKNKYCIVLLIMQAKHWLFFLLLLLEHCKLGLDVVLSSNI